MYVYVCSAAFCVYPCIIFRRNELVVQMRDMCLGKNDFRYDHAQKIVNGCD